jgi:hypothetical protein
MPIIAPHHRLTLNGCIGLLSHIEIPMYREEQTQGGTL